METWNITVLNSFAGRTLDEFVGVFCVGEKKRNKIKQEGLAILNGAVVPFETILKEKDLVTFDLTPFEKLDYLPENPRLKVLYEDDWLLIIDKPAGLIVYPESKDGTGTLVNRIAGFYQNHGLDRQIRYLHRLDRDTTGCFAVAKNFLTHSYFSALWDHRQIQRTYLALVGGCPEPATGVIHKPIGRDRHVNNKYRVSDTGDSATTEYEVLHNYDGYSLVRLRPLTGRTHQIRVHMAFIGHPLLGDLTYGGDLSRIQRTALHSESVSFPNPFKTASVTARAPISADMAALAGAVPL